MQPQAGEVASIRRASDGCGTEGGRDASLSSNLHG
jgi:hypothetical protein